MSIEVKVPRLPESVEDATVATWHKRPGDPVRRDENLVDLETDKVMLEVPAPAAGVLGEARVGEGDVVKAGQVVAILEEGAGAEGKAGEAPAAPARGNGEAGVEGRSDEGDRSAEAAEPPAKEAETRRGAKEQALSPAVRRLVEEHGLTPEKIEGTGKGGRLTKADVIAYLEHGDRQAEPPPSQEADAVEPERAESADADEAGAGTMPEARAPRESEERLEQRVPMTRLRARIAERLVRAQQTAAILSTFNEVDLKAVNDLRRRYRETFEREHGVRLGLMSFFVKATVEALKRFPVINASVDGRDIVYHGYFDIGIAVASPRGLVVPILRDADRMSFAQVEKSIRELTEKAREGALTLDDLTGGTFSITNGGVFGSMLSTPILNPPQSAILGMHAVQDRAVVVDGEITIRPMMYVALSYDHRLIDGKDAVQFLYAVKALLEEPSRLLLQI